MRAWVLLTTLEELRGFEESIGKRRPTGEAYSRNFGGDNWLDQRRKSEAYADRDPTVLVIGGGQAGLAIAARLGPLGIDTLVVDRNERIGDNWRTRYHSLALHNQIHVNHLPYMPFPPTWPKYIPKDMLANWFEYYAGAMEINFWTGTEFVGATYDEAARRWTARLKRLDGTERTMRPRHLVFANGVSGIPKVPSLPGLDDFAGTILHAHGFTDGSAWRGKNALVLGTGNSGHDMAQDLHSHGAATTIIQRGSTTVVSIDPSAKLNYALYDEGPPLEDCDLIATAATYPLIVRAYQLAVERMVEFDKELIAGLIARGFKYDLGEDKTGHQMKYRRRGGGYYLDAGCSGLIIEGEIGLLQFDTIERFVAGGALLRDGTVVPADLLVLATGYHTQLELMRRVLGEDVARRIGPVWGWGEDGEMSNMWRRTAQDGLWFIAGSLAQCRIYSKYLALQIKALEEGLIAGSRAAERRREKRGHAMMPAEYDITGKVVFITGAGRGIGRGIARGAGRGRRRRGAQRADATLRRGRRRGDRRSLRPARRPGHRRRDDVGRGQAGRRPGACHVRAYRCAGERAGRCDPQAARRPARPGRGGLRPLRRRSALHHGHQPHRGAAVHARGGPAHARRAGRARSSTSPPGRRTRAAARWCCIRRPRRRSPASRAPRPSNGLPMASR